MTDDDLIAREREGWDALCTPGGADYYREHLTADALLAFPFGVVDRAQALDAMSAAPPWSRYEMTGARVVRLGRDAAVVAYAVTAQRAGEPTFSAVLSSTFVREGTEWRLAFHQQSPRASD